MNMAEYKKVKVEFILRRDQLIYDISNGAFIEGDIMPEDSGKLRTTLQDLTQDGNIDRTDRVMNLAVSECEEMLYPYTKKEVRAESCDNAPSELDRYVISAELPEQFSQTTVDMLAKLLHEYVVSRVLADWIFSTKPESMAKWLDRVDDVKARIKQTMSIRRKKIRRGVSPF